MRGKHHINFEMVKHFKKDLSAAAEELGALLPEGDDPCEYLRAIPSAERAVLREQMKKVRTILEKIGKHYSASYPRDDEWKAIKKEWRFRYDS